MKIISTTTTADGTTMQVRRDDGSVYTVSVIPQDGQVLLHFDGTAHHELAPRRVAANQVAVEFK